MARRGAASRWWTTPALTALTMAAFLAAPAPAQWSEFSRPPAEEPARGPIAEPFFALLVDLSAGDSLGVWTGAEIRRRVGRDSRFPLDQLVRVSRQRPDSARSEAYPEAEARAVWRLDLDEALDFAMPYGILGYNPGSLRVGASLVLTELAAGDLYLGVGSGAERRDFALDDCRFYALEDGYVLLDADALIDALVGPALDDSWSLGFATGWGRGRLLGVGVFAGRDGRPIFGEFDFVRDKVLPHGGDEARALSRAGRQRFRAGGRLPAPWSRP